MGVAGETRLFIGFHLADVVGILLPHGNQRVESSKKRRKLLRRLLWKLFHSPVGIALVLTRAVEANDYGQVVSIDINPKAGAFCRDWPDDRLRLLNGDSVEILRSLKEPEVDLFVHDSLHTHEYEAAELRAIGMNLSPGAFVLSDKSRDSDALLD